MNDELQEALTVLLEKSMQGTDFVIDQAPEVVSQLLRWEMTISLLWFIVGVAVLATSIKALLIGFRSCKKGGRLYDTGDDIFLLLLIVPAAIGVTYMGTNLDWLQILIAPKVFLLEYVAGLVG